MKRSPEEILDAAAVLVDREGVGVSTAKVAAAAGVSNGTLFNYFPTKKSLIDALYLRLKSLLVAAVGEVDQSLEPVEQFRGVWQRWGDWAAADPIRHRVALLLHGAGLVSPTATAQVDTMLAPLVDALAAAAARGQMVDLPLPYLSRLLELQLNWAVQAGLSPTQRAAAFDMAWRSVSSPSTN